MARRLPIGERRLYQKLDGVSEAEKVVKRIVRYDGKGSAAAASQPPSNAPQTSEVSGIRHGSNDADCTSTITDDGGETITANSSNPAAISTLLHTSEPAPLTAPQTSSVAATRPLKIASGSTKAGKSRSEAQPLSNGAIVPESGPGNTPSDPSALAHAPSAPHTPKAQTTTIPPESPTSIFSGRSINIRNLPMSPLTSVNEPSPIFALCVVDFHHVRGPEIQHWLSPEGTNQLALFPNLPFQALPDGAHLFQELFSQFTLLFNREHQSSPAPLAVEDPSQTTTLFGCGCIRQVASLELAPLADHTRSVVQKTVVVISYHPMLNIIKDKLRMVTNSYFDQHDFSDTSILSSLLDDLSTSHRHISQNHRTVDNTDYYMNLNLGSFLLRFRLSLLQIFKLLLLEKRVMIYSSSDDLNDFELNLISLIPNLMGNLQDCGSPLLANRSQGLRKPSSLNTEDRASMLRFYGLPLQVFAQGGFFYPYILLQQLDDLSDKRSRFYLVGTSNRMLKDRKQLYDVLVNLDTNLIEVQTPELEACLALTPTDRRFMESMVRDTVRNYHQADTQYLGSDDYIRVQFEEYLLSLLLTSKCNTYMAHYGPPPGLTYDNRTGNLALFNEKFVTEWMTTENYRMWLIMADDFAFNFQDPHHIGLDREALGWVERLTLANTTLGPEPGETGTLSPSGDNPAGALQRLPLASQEPQPKETKSAFSFGLFGRALGVAGPPQLELAPETRDRDMSPDCQSDKSMVTETEASATTAGSLKSWTAWAFKG